MKRLGPYKHKQQGYLYFIEIDEDGKRKTIYVHREILERKIGRRLTKDEVAHHINEIKTDNREDNLEVKTIASHTKHHAKEITILTLECHQCHKTFKREQRQAKENKGYKKAFCSLRCSGIYYAPVRPTG